LEIYGQDYWQPTEIIKHIESYETSTGPARIETNVGQAILKPLGNSLGPHVLARELIAIQLANWFKLPTFEYAVIDLQEEDMIPLGKQKLAMPGPSFLTKYHIGEKWDGTEKGLEAVENCEIITRLVAFDNWILNVDRHPPDVGSRKANFGNVFLSQLGAAAGKFRMIVMDHTHCLRVRNTEDLSERITHIDYVRDERAYGVFPAFVKYLKRSQLSSALSKLNEFSESDAEEILSKLPSQWQVSENVQLKIKEFLIQRADFLVQRLPNILSTYNMEQGNLRI